jgi:curved DNA-binding protein
MPENGFLDYYELLQISPNAENETIHRVYKMLAQRYHPDNPETGDLSRFLLLNQAFETLTDPDRRAEYNVLYEESRTQPIELFETKDFDLGVDGEANRRMGILCLLYARRRSNPDDPGISLLEFESIMSLPREHLLFTMWYLKEHDYLRQDEASDYVITGPGARARKRSRTPSKPRHEPAAARNPDLDGDPGDRCRGVRYPLAAHPQLADSFRSCHRHRPQYFLV